MRGMIKRSFLSFLILAVLFLAACRSSEQSPPVSADAPAEVIEAEVPVSEVVALEVEGSAEVASLEVVESPESVSSPAVPRRKVITGEVIAPKPVETVEVAVVEMGDPVESVVIEATEVVEPEVVEAVADESVAEKVVAKEVAVKTEAVESVEAVAEPVVTEAAVAPAVEVPDEAPVAEPAKPIADIRIVMHTSAGDIEATLFATKTPVTVANFLNLTKRGFYDGLTFHRVIPDFMIQGGDPDGTGRGGPGYKFEDEFHSDLRHARSGIFSMANSGPRTNGSQFFITHRATQWLDNKHTVFGKVTSGQKVVDAIRRGATIKSIDVLDSTDALFAKEQGRIDKWNAVLDR